MCHQGFIEGVEFKAEGLRQRRPDPTNTPPVPTDTAQPMAERAPVEAEEEEAVMIQGHPLLEFYLDTCGGCHGTFREGALDPALIPHFPQLSQTLPTLPAC